MTRPPIQTSSRSSMRGVNLVELMVTLSVLAILLTIAVPSFTELVRNNRVVSTGTELASALNNARAEAVKRGKSVTVCRTANPNDASPTCSTTAGGWESGWLVFVDGSTLGTVDAGDTRLRVGQAPTGGVSVTASANFTDRVTYDSRGASQASGTLDICLAGTMRRISINNVGRSSIQKGTC